MRPALEQDYKVGLVCGKNYELMPFMYETWEVLFSVAGLCKSSERNMVANYTSYACL